jgi:Cdc6-like AAA superfamily ATPase
VESSRKLANMAGEVFTPSAPIDKHSLFAGRTRQLRKVVDAVNQRGQHAILYGERGVGKTSLANVIADNLSVPGGRLLMPHINADTGDTFTSLWRKVLTQITLYNSRNQAGFLLGNTWHHQDLTENLPETISTGDIRKLLAPLATNFQTVVIIDEFDRLPPGQARTMMADTIKMLADHTAGITLVLVGVADNVDELIAEHQSISRNLIQVPLQRMSTEELGQIITNGLGILQMTIEPGALAWITFVSRGLPHYTHLLGRFAARSAIDQSVLRITMGHVAAGITEALGDAQHTISDAYHKATDSPRKDAMYRKVLLACAIAQTDELGFFAPVDVRKPLNAIVKREKDYDITDFHKHLNEFCEPKRGLVLEKRGVSHRPRYRFRDAMVQPYVILKGFNDRLLTHEVLATVNPP